MLWPSHLTRLAKEVFEGLQGRFLPEFKFATGLVECLFKRAEISPRVFCEDEVRA
jgi:hypothetical protein